MSSPSQSKLTSLTVVTKPKESENALATSSNKTTISLDTNLLTVVKQNDFHHILKEIGNRLLVVEFFAQWCGPCQSLSVKLEQLANSYKGKILIVKVDVDEFEELTLEYNISAIPTFMLMKNQTKLEQFSSSNVETLEKNVEKYAGKPVLSDVDVEKAKSNEKVKITQSAREMKEKE